MRTHPEREVEFNFVPGDDCPNYPHGEGDAHAPECQICEGSARTGYCESHGESDCETCDALDNAMRNGLADREGSR